MKDKRKLIMQSILSTTRIRSVWLAFVLLSFFCGLFLSLLFFFLILAEQTVLRANLKLGAVHPARRHYNKKSSEDLSPKH